MIITKKPNKKPVEPKKPAVTEEVKVDKEEAIKIEKYLIDDDE